MVIATLCHLDWAIISLLVKVSGEYFSFQTLLSFMR